MGAEGRRRRQAGVGSVPSRDRTGPRRTHVRARGSCRPAAGGRTRRESRAAAAGQGSPQRRSPSRRLPASGPARNDREAASRGGQPSGRGVPGRRQPSVRGLRPHSAASAARWRGRRNTRRGDHAAARGGRACRGARWIAGVRAAGGHDRPARRRPLDARRAARGIPAGAEGPVGGRLPPLSRSGPRSRRRGGLRVAGAPSIHPAPQAGGERPCRVEPLRRVRPAAGLPRRGPLPDAPTGRPRPAGTH